MALMEVEGGGVRAGMAERAGRRPRWAEPALGMLIGLSILALLGYWFAIADRYAVFLYEHVDRLGDLPARPFDAMTRSRYWMSGLVADGAVLVVGLCAIHIGTRRAATRGVALKAPDGRRLWLWAAPFLALGIPGLTLRANAPTLDGPLAAAVTCIALAGLALALLPLSWAANRPRELWYLAAQGAGVGLPMLGWRAIELPGRGVLGPIVASLILGGSLVGGLLILAAVGRLRAAAGLPSPGWAPSLLAALGWLLLIGPLAHHLFFTPPQWRYITAGPNIYGHAPGVAMSGLVLGAALAGLAEYMAGSIIPHTLNRPNPLETP